jgi:hypothetical protein
LWAWLTLQPKLAVFPQISHTFDMIGLPQNELNL